MFFAFSALTLLVGRQEGHPACRKTEWWGVGVVVCLEQGADLHMALLTPLPLTVSCSSKIQIGFTFLVPAHPGSPGKRAVKRVCVTNVLFVVLVRWQEGHPACKKMSGWVLAWLSVFCFSKSRLVLPFWYRLTWLVPEEGPLMGVC